GFQRCGKAHLFFHLFRKSVIIFIVNLLLASFRPVLFCCSLLSFHHISIYIQPSPHMFHGFPSVRLTVLSRHIFGSTHADSSNTVANTAVLRRCRTRLIIIVYNVHVHSFATVTSGSCPVIKHIVAHIHIFTFLRRNMRTQTGHATFVMSHQIMMKGRPVSAYNGSVTMFSLSMPGCTQTF